MTTKTLSESKILMEDEIDSEKELINVYPEKKVKQFISELKEDLIETQKEKEQSRKHHEDMGDYGRGYCDASEQFMDVIEDKIDKLAGADLI